MLTLRTLGGFSLGHSPEQGDVEVFGPSKPLALITYLACAPGRACRRELLIDLLWADVEPDAASHALRQTLWFIRQRCGQEFIHTSGGVVKLAGAVAADREAFQDAVARGDMSSAVALYGGDFVPSFGAPGGADFEHWVDLERDRLRTLFTHCAGNLCRQQLEAGRSREAVALARRVCESSGYGEFGCRLLLETLLSAGDLVAAASEAEAMARRLAAEGRIPEPATVTLLNAARQTTAETGKASPSASLVTALIGRETEFAGIVGAWETARAGQRQLLHVTGAAGFGKSRLLSDATNRLRAKGARCVALRASPADRRIQGAFVSLLADALSSQPGAMSISPAAAGALVGLHPALANRFPNAVADSASGEEAVRRRALALADLVAAITDESPLAIIADDVHWVDVQSRDILSAVVARLERAPLLLLTAGRPIPEGRLHDVEDDGYVLTPLSVPQVAELLSSTAELPEEPWADQLPVRLHTATAGVPLLLLETLQLLSERQVVEIGPGGWRCRDASLLDALLRQGGALHARIADLERAPGWLLLVLSVAGFPLSNAELLACAHRSGDTVESDLMVLEQRGLVARTDGQWEPGHDTIAEIAEQLASVEALRAAHAAIGRALAGADRPDRTTMARAAEHLLSGWDTEGLRSVLSRWLKKLRAAGDRRPVRDLVIELTGLPASDERIATLIRDLPVRARLDARTLWRIAAVLALVTTASTVAVLASREPAGNPTALLVAFRMEDSARYAGTAIPLDPDRLTNSRPLDFRSAGRLPLESPRDVGAMPRPGGGAWATSDAFSDPGSNQDVVVLSDRPPRRITRAKGDDSPESWSPDGSRLLIYTDRWDNRSQGDLAIYDPATDSVIQLTEGPTRDHSGRWSPDGTRVVYAADLYDSSDPILLCWIAVDRGSGGCRRPPYQLISIGGWINSSEVVAQVRDSTGREFVASLDVDRMTGRLLFRGVLNGTANSWILCTCRERDSEPLVMNVRHLARPSVGLPVTGLGRAQGRPFLVGEQGALARAPHLHRLDIGGPAGDSVELATPIQLHASGYDQQGAPIEVPVAVLRWSTSDTTIVTVNDSGVAIPQRSGRATITASAGGWRAATFDLVVSGRGAARDRLTESWNDQWPARWQAFGMPRPTIVAAPWGRGFWHRGDSTHHSGVYSLESWSGADGIGFEATVHVPIERPAWQSLSLGLLPIANRDQLRLWDHRTGGWTPSSEDTENACTFGVPGGEGRRYRDEVALSAGRLVTHIAVDSVRRREPYRVTVQLRRDGYCELAINDTVLAVSESRVHPGRDYHIWMSGMSYRTTILVGPLRVWTGIHPALERSRQRRNP